VRIFTEAFAFANILFQYNWSFEFWSSFVPCLLGANINFKAMPWTSKISSFLDVSFCFLFLCSMLIRIKAWLMRINHKSIIVVLFMAKEVCVLFVCDNFSFLLVQSFLCTNFFMCKAMCTKPLCVNLLLYAKLKGNGRRWVMSQIWLHKGFIQSTYLTNHLARGPWILTLRLVSLGWWLL
jgi:hypothetical protein